MTQCNSVLLVHFMSSFNHRSLSAQLQEFCKTFQNFYENTVLASFIKSDCDENSRNVFRSSSVRSDMNTFDELNEKFLQVVKIFIINVESFKKETAFRNHLFHLNVYLTVHYTDVI